MFNPTRLPVLCLLVGCGAPAPAPVSGTFPLEVGPAGGVIEGAVGTEFEGLKLEIPAGALTEKVTLNAFLNEEEPELGPGANFVGPSYEFSPRAQVFAKPVKLTVPVSGETLSSFGQTTDTCLMWLRAADASWSQAAAVAFTDTVVTAETSTLVQAAVGVKSIIIKAPPHPLTLPCTNPAGFCVDVNSEKLRANNSGWSTVLDRKMLYRRTTTDAGVTRTFVTEYDLALGRQTFESPAYVPPAGTAPSFAPNVVVSQQVSRGPDDAGWAPVLHGLARFGPTGAPTLLPDVAANGKTTGVVFTPDGRMHRQLVTVADGSTTMRVSSSLGGAEVTPVVVETVATTFSAFSPASFPFFRVGQTNAIGFESFDARTGFPRVMDFIPPAAPTAVSLHPDVRQRSGRSHIVDVVMSDDGALVATTAVEASATLYVQSRDGLLSRAYPGLPRLKTVEFGEPGFIYAAAQSAAHVYRVELATGAIQTIELTSSTDEEVIQSRQPMALRHVVLPMGHVMYVIAGAVHSNRSVLLIRPAQ